MTADLSLSMCLVFSDMRTGLKYERHNKVIGRFALWEMLAPEMRSGAWANHAHLVLQLQQLGALGVGKAAGGGGLLLRGGGMGPQQIHCLPQRLRLLLPRLRHLQRMLRM